MRRGAGVDGQHVLNPATNRLERLGLANALLEANARAGGEEADERWEDEPPGPQQPINVDLIGTVRGRCHGCDRCDGYQRGFRDAENPNDTDVLRCARCGCQAHEHEAL